MAQIRAAAGASACLVNSNPGGRVIGESYQVPLRALPGAHDASSLGYVLFSDVPPPVSSPGTFDPRDVAPLNGLKHPQFRRTDHDFLNPVLPGWSGLLLSLRFSS